MIASGSESLDPAQSRLAEEIAWLAQVPTLTYRISHRHKRTLIFIQVTPIVAHEKHPPSRLRGSGYGSDLQERGNSGRQGLFHNEFMFEESKDRLEVLSREELFQEVVEVDEGREENYGNVIFTFIMHHDLYPFEAPYITASLPTHWPRRDDFRNYFYQIMRTDSWWPLLSLIDIIQQLPTFAYQLLRSIRREGQYCGQFEAEVPLYRQDMLEVSPHFMAVQMQVKEKKGALAAYKLGWTYFTYSAVLLLSETSPSLFYLRSAIQVQAMKNAIGVNKKGLYRLEIHMKDGTLYKFKLPEEDNQLLHRITLFQLYYQTKMEPLPHYQKQALKSIDIYNQIIIHTDMLHMPQATSWAKNKILQAAVLLQ